MSEAPLMVGVSGLRGIVGKSLTPGVADRFASGFAGWLIARGGRRAVVIARDGRAGGEHIHRAVIAAFSRRGFEVIDLGIATTPTAGVMTDHLSAAGAMIITASHNPQEWNGLKCLIRHLPEPGDADAAAPPAVSAREIAAEFESGTSEPPERGTEGVVSGRGDAAAIHVSKVMNALAAAGVFKGASVQRRRLVLDSVNASGVEGGRRLLAQSLGCELIHLGADDSGVFPHAPEPTRENLADLGRSVARFNAEVGFGQDPDADRLAIVDGDGRYIGEEYTLALAAEALLSAPGRSKGRTGVLVANLSTSRMIDDVAARHDARVVRTPVGEANVVDAMKRLAAAGEDVVLGGEGNGGVIWPRVTYVRDSLSAMALVLSLMDRTSDTVAGLIAGMPRYAIEKRKVDLARREDASPAIESIARAYAEHRIDRQDGIRIDFTKGPLAGAAWLHIRASNTEPIMRLIAEAPREEDARRVLDDAAGVIARG